jgi:MoaA/NifB/PqqE/SkfB family radical SAM enzyme
MFDLMRWRMSSLRPRLRYVLGRPAPSLVSIDVSGACNLHCRMCSLDSANPRVGMMSVDELSRLSTHLKGVPVIELSSGCEPTLNPGLEHMLAILRGDHPQAFLNLTTNATRISDDLIRVLVDNRVDKLLVSLDAADPDLYESIRVGARFAAVVANLRRLAEGFQASASAAPELEVICTLMSLNADQMIPLIDLLASLGIRSLIMNGLVPFTSESAGWKMWGLDSEPEELAALAGRAARHAEDAGLSLLFADFAARRVRRCWDTNPVISWDGQVSPCFMCSFDRTAYLEGYEVRFPRVVLGNANLRPLPVVWQSPRAIVFRLTRALGVLPEYCRMCAMQMGVLCPYRKL